MYCRDAIQPPAVHDDFCVRIGSSYGEDFIKSNPTDVGHIINTNIFSYKLLEYMGPFLVPPVVSLFSCFEILPKTLNPARFLPLHASCPEWDGTLEFISGSTTRCIQCNRKCALSWYSSFYAMANFSLILLYF